MPFGRVKSIGHFLNNFILFFLLKKSFPIPNVSIDQWIFSVFIVWFPCYLFSDYFYGYCYYLLILICFADFQLTLLVFFYRLLSGISNSGFLWRVKAMPSFVFLQNQVHFQVMYLKPWPCQCWTRDHADSISRVAWLFLKVAFLGKRGHVLRSRKYWRTRLLATIKPGLPVDCGRQ